MIRSIFSWVVLVAALLFICMMLVGCGQPSCQYPMFQPGTIVVHKVTNQRYIVLETCQTNGLLRGDVILVRNQSGFSHRIYDFEVELEVK